VVDGFISELGERVVRGHALDVRENVRFQGGYFARWIHGRYSDVGVALAIELKKTFMDEWTGEIDAEHLAELHCALGAAAAKSTEAFSELDR
jgi:N-formylglutamate deformylase